MKWLNDLVGNDWWATNGEELLFILGLVVLALVATYRHNTWGRHK